MMRPSVFPVALSMLFALLTALSCFGAEAMTVKPIPGEKVETTRWTAPALLDVRSELVAWLHTADDAKQGEASLSRWPETEPVVGIGGRALLEKTIETMRRVSTPVAEYLTACDTLAWKELPFGRPLVLPQIPLQVYLGETGPSKYLSGSLRFYLAKRLVQARLYDEAKPVLDGMTPDNSIDPTDVLLTRALVCSRLGDTENGRTALEEFRAVVEGDDSVSRRHLELAKLIEFDLKRERKEDDPENIARQMDDVRRRLGQGRTDEDTRKAEGDVMKSLEKLIEQIEDRSKQQARRIAEGGQPADDSRILKQKAPGNVDRREFDPDGHWGSLPPRDREEALLRIEKEFPPHYRDIIEQYFREMAN